MKKLIYLLLPALFIANYSMSQCTVTIDAVTDTVDCGGCFDLTAVGFAGDTLLNEDFNNSSLGPGWSSNQTVMYTNPCGAPPDNSPSAWFGNSQTQPRILETVDYDMSCGGEICYMMKYAVQGGSGSCEGPDLANEGVDLQYSIDGGVTWTSIFYHTVLNGGNDPYQTAWNEYCQQIPTAAQTTSTRFRWYQDAGSGAGFDHWGIDDVGVYGTSCGTYYYDWFVDGTPNSADTNLCIAQNVDTYNVIYTDGISDTCSASIDMYGIIDPNLPGDTIICGLGNYDLVSTPTGGSGDFTYLWNNGDTDSIYENVTTGDYYIDIQDNVYPGCTASDSASLEINPIPDVNFSAEYLCQGITTEFTDLTSLSSGSISTWDWDFDDQGATSTDQNPTHVFSGVGVYDVTLTVESAEGCTSDTTITIEIVPPPYAAFDYDSICEGEEAFFTNESLNNYENSQWIFETAENDTVYSTDASFTFADSGVYDVTLIIEMDGGVCSDTITQSITVYPLPNVVFATNTQIGEPPLQVDFYNQSTPPAVYTWNFANGNISNDQNDTVSETFLEPGEYTVLLTGTSPEGCENSYSMVITVEFEDLVVEIPNIFTPNGDKTNDEFFINYIQARETISDFHIVILNRWGNVMAEFTDPDFVWDGTKRGGPAVSDGTYFYKLKISTVKGQEINEHGFIQVESD